MQPAELMDIALKAGEIMLTSGAEIYRVEETIVRICNSYGKQCESFVLPTGIFISIKDGGGGTHTSFKRIQDRTIDLNKIDRVNSLSRSLQKKRLSYEEATKSLADIESEKQHSFPLRIAAAALSSLVFTLLFNGSWIDGLASFVIGAVTYIFREVLVVKRFFPFLEVFLSGFVAGFLSIVACHYFSGLNEYKIIIGSIIMYLPGVSITNGIKDALYGDLVSSLARLGGAVLLVAALAAGVGVAFVLGIRR